MKENETKHQSGNGDVDKMKMRLSLGSVNKNNPDRKPCGVVNIPMSKKL